MEGFTLMVLGYRVWGNSSGPSTGSGRPGVNGYSSGLSMSHVEFSEEALSEGKERTCLVYLRALARLTPCRYKRSTRRVE